MQTVSSVLVLVAGEKRAWLEMVQARYDASGAPYCEWSVLPGGEWQGVFMLW